MLLNLFCVTNLPSIFHDYSPIRENQDLKSYLDLLSEQWSSVGNEYPILELPIEKSFNFIWIISNFF